MKRRIFCVFCPRNLRWVVHRTESVVYLVYSVLMGFSKLGQHGKLCKCINFASTILRCGGLYVREYVQALFSTSWDAVCYFDLRQLLGGSRSDPRCTRGAEISGS
jgi:hypothetical protein